MAQLPIIMIQIKHAEKNYVFVTLSWIWNKVMVKMKGMLHIYNVCTIDWHQVCANMSSGLGWVAHTKYHPYSGRTDKQTDGRTDGRTHTQMNARTWILCPPYSPCGGQQTCKTIGKKFKYFVWIKQDITSNSSIKWLDTYTYVKFKSSSVRVISFQKIDRHNVWSQTLSGYLSSHLHLDSDTSPCFKLLNNGTIIVYEGDIA